MGSFIDNQTQSANYTLQATQARAQGQLARKQAYANAYKLQDDSAQAAYIMGDRMMTARQNAVASISALRTQNAASGFSASGSKLRAEQSTAEILDAAISNMGKSYTISDQNARAQAAQLMREGDTAVSLAEIQGRYFDQLRSINKKVAPWQLGADAMLFTGKVLTAFNTPSASKDLSTSSQFSSPLVGSMWTPTFDNAYMDSGGFVGLRRN